MQVTNNILVIVLNSGRKLTFSFPSGKPKKTCIQEAIEIDGIDNNEIKKYYFISGREGAKEKITPALMEETLNVVTNKVNPLAEVRNNKLTEIRRYRDLLLKKLDIEFIKTLEDDGCEECRRHIIEIKKYFRDIPQKFINRKLSSVEEVKNFNVFDNIFNIYITEPGTGYTSTPQVSIDPPNNYPLYKGFRMKAEALIENGSLKDIIVTQIGSSYIAQPDVTISPPDEEGGEQAEATTSIPENNIDIPNTIIQNLKLNGLI